MLHLEQYSIGVGDRFAHQARAQLQACQLMSGHGIRVIPVWNKSNREHLTVGSEPSSVRQAADAAVTRLGWTHPYHVDADHIRLGTVDRFIPHSDFFTLDVADQIGQPADSASVEAFVKAHGDLAGSLEVTGLGQPIRITLEELRRVAETFLAAIQEAGRLYRHIAQQKGEGRFITEISMDETDRAQTPAELLIILAAIASEGIPVQTLAPKFTGRFNKGVDYSGDLRQFEEEFNADLAVIAFAIRRFGLPPNLKLSVHSGSDKFSLYAPIHRALARSGAGLHLKTAGTTWLEEMIGLAESGGEGLNMARRIYAEALDHRDELCAPYAAVIDIDAGQLPSAGTVEAWSSEEFAAALRHDPACDAFNPHFRQLLHVGYKIAAKLGEPFLQMIEACESRIAKNVTENLCEKHLRPVFPGSSGASETESACVSAGWPSSLS